MGRTRTCRRAGEIEVAPIGVELNGSQRVHAAGVALAIFKAIFKAVLHPFHLLLEVGGVLPLLLKRADLVGLPLQLTDLFPLPLKRGNPDRLLTSKSGNIFRVGIFLDFVGLTTRTMHHPYGGGGVRVVGRTKPS